MKRLRLIDGLDAQTKQQWGALLRAYEGRVAGKGENADEVPVIADYVMQRAAVRTRSGKDWQGWTRLVEDGSFDYDGGEKTLDWYGVTEGEKRDGSRVRVDGIDVSNLRKNPVFVGFHKYDEPPIGRIVATRLGETPDGKRAFIISVARLGVPEVREDGTVNRYVQRANELMDFAEHGGMRAVSFGWRGLEFEPILTSDDKIKGWDFIRSDALEFSLVTVPADANATAVLTLQRKITEGRLQPEDIVTGRPRAVYIMREAIEPDAAIPSLPELPVLSDGAPAGVAEEVVRDLLQHGADPIRWNRALPEAFDVTTQDFEPDSREIELAAKFTGAAVRDLARTHVDLASVRMPAWLCALDVELPAAWDVLDVRNLTSASTEKPLERAVLQLNSTRRQDFLIQGTRFLQHRETGARMTLKVQPTWWGLHVTALGPAAGGAMQSLLDATQARAAAMKLLQGEAFSLSGEFLTRDASDGFDGLFLTANQSASLRQVVKLLKEKGAAMPARGLMLIGPPGTGKTSAARVVMNEAPGATIVWVSARDFYRFGSYGVFTYAFDLLREQGPGVVVFEDCDHWIDKTTVDLIKTEMDGLARNNGGIVTMLTSNFPERMPAALIDRPGRFHEVMKFDLPGAEVRERMLRAWASEAFLADAEVVRAAVEGTEGYSGAHVRELVTFATILHEQEGVAEPEALTRALAKLAEQRKLIAESRGGQRHVPGAHVMQRWFADPTRMAPTMERTDETPTWLPSVFATVEVEQRAGRVIARRNQTRIEKGRDVLLSVADAVTQIAASLREGAAELQAVLDDAGAGQATEEPAAPDAPSADDMVASAREVVAGLTGAVASLELAAIGEVAREFRESADELEEQGDVEEPHGGFYDEVRAELAAALDGITDKEG